jgi:hypothetical protein
MRQGVLDLIEATRAEHVSSRELTAQQSETGERR